MIAPLAKLMDWSAIQIVAMMAPTHAPDPRLEEALQFLQGPDFVPADSQPARVEFIPDQSGLHFRFSTPQPCDFAENNIVHGRLYRCAERWQERPVIILLHGWGDSLNYTFLFPLIARRCNRAGFNVATLVSPYHFQRRPRRRGTFASGDCLLLAKSTAQAISEIRALTGWLVGQGCPAVALWGISMGAWHAGMAACQESRLTSVVLTAPCARLSPWVEQRAVKPGILARLQSRRELCEKLNTTALNLTLGRPAIPRQNILLIEGVHDFMCPKDDIEDLWQAWGQPDIWRLPYGHVGVCCGFVPDLPGRVLRWLSPRLNQPAVTDQRAR